jgi:heme/copper-type cytochrome/quinol oxidase subunit 2
LNKPKLTLIIILTTLIALSSLSAITAQTWQEVTTITGAASQKTNYFNIPVKEARYEWSYATSTPTYAGFYVTLYKEDNSIYVDMLMAPSGQTSGTQYLHNLSPGNYYIDVGAANLDSYTIKVESQTSGNAATPKPTNNNDAGSSDGGDSAAGLVAVAVIAAIVVVLIFVFMRRRNKKR